MATTVTQHLKLMQGITGICHSSCSKLVCVSCFVYLNTHLTHFINIKGDLQLERKSLGL